MSHGSTPPRHLSYDFLREITDGFSEERGRGSGSYGKVYLGVNKDGEKIAVKLLHGTSSVVDNDKQFEKEFHNLTCLQHPNIVRFVGYCHETHRECVPYKGKMILADVTKRALCFEYMDNGSLDSFLSDESSGHDWHTRYAIIKGICDGLKYLHEELHHPIFHLDLKPANILLDEHMVPKLADFGLSRLLGEERTQITTSSIGTIGYLPPEFINQHVISNKFDIFSLGVVIIKIMAGRTGYFKCGEMSSHKFIELVHENWRSRLHGKSSCVLKSYSEQVKRCMEIALSCVEADRQLRPNIGDIVCMLNETETMIPDIWDILNELNETEIVSQFPDGSPNALGSSMDQERNRPAQHAAEPGGPDICGIHNDESPNALRLSMDQLMSKSMRSAQQLNHTRPEEMLDMSEIIDDAHADAQVLHAISAAKMLKQQGNELYGGGHYVDAAAKYKLAKDIMKNIPSAAGQTLQLQCSLNLMSCYLKSAKFQECIDEGSDVLTYDFSNAKAYYRRGQAYKELGNLEAAVSDFSTAHEISPEDETIAEVLRNTEGKLTTEGGGSNLLKGVIEENLEEDNAEPSSIQRSSRTGYTVPQLHERAGNSRQPESSESLRSDPATERQTQRIEEGKRERERLNNTWNLFGVVVDNYMLDKMKRYVGKPKTREDRAREAYMLMNEDDKLRKATEHLDHIRNRLSFNVRNNTSATKCLFYNATGDTLYHVANHDWASHVSGAPYPAEIGNGQWSAVWHAKDGAQSSTAAVVYRGKNYDGEDQDYLLAWRSPSFVFFHNKCYCEIGGVDNFQKRWPSLKKKLSDSGNSANAKSNGYAIKATTETSGHPKFTAIISFR
ncbi:unnamed protein product [Alopecurus aequalis]